MNAPFEKRLGPDRLEDGELDRLVDGELSETECRALLGRFDREPEGWRRCALAFLEAQSWRTALGELAGSAEAAPWPRSTLMPGRGKRIRRARIFRMSALAAGFAAMFVLGWTSHPERLEEPVQEFAAQQGAPTQRAGSEQAETPLIALPIARNPPDASAKPGAGLDPLVTQWERRGYHAERQKRVVAVETSDGRTIGLPVEEVRLRYVGDRTY